MGDWKEVKLKDVVSILGDGLHGTPKYNPNGDYYFINGSNLMDGEIAALAILMDHYKPEKQKKTGLFSRNSTYMVLIRQYFLYNSEIEI